MNLRGNCADMRGEVWIRVSVSALSFFFHPALQLSRAIAAARSLAKKRLSLFIELPRRDGHQTYIGRREMLFRWALPLATIWRMKTFIESMLGSPCRHVLVNEMADISEGLSPA